MLLEIAPVRLEVRRGFITAYKMRFIKRVLNYALGYKRHITIILKYRTLFKSSVMQYTVKGEILWSILCT
jgi:hypothetical protein